MTYIRRTTLILSDDWYVLMVLFVHLAYTTNAFKEEYYTANITVFRTG